MQEIRDFAAEAFGRRGTAIYRAPAQAFQDALSAGRQAPNRCYSIVLMSDGESNRGMTEPAAASMVPATRST